MNDDSTRKKNRDSHDDLLDTPPAYNPDQAEGEDFDEISGGGSGSGSRSDDDMHRRRRPSQAEGEDEA